MSRLSQLALNDEGFAFDPSTGDSFVLNESGLVILKGFRDGMAATAIAACLADQFDVECDEAERDVHDLAERLRYYGLL